MQVRLAYCGYGDLALTGTTWDVTGINEGKSFTASGERGDEGD
jgi:hypothetical protein